MTPLLLGSPRVDYLCILYENSGFFKRANLNWTAIDLFKEFQKEILMDGIGSFMKSTPEPCKIDFH